MVHRKQNPGRIPRRLRSRIHGPRTALSPTHKDFVNGAKKGLARVPLRWLACGPYSPSFS